MSNKSVFVASLIAMGLLASGSGHATAKLIYQYDPSNDRVVNIPVENQTFGDPNWSYEQNYREDSLSRASRFKLFDILGKSLIDFGCNEGGILLACQSLGAGKIIGIDNNPWCISRAKEKVKKGMIPNAEFIEGDLENKGLLARLPKVNTVFLLAVLDTSNFTNKTAIIANVSRLAKDALYYEGHQNGASHVSRMQEFLLATDFTRLEYLGRFNNRILMRFGRELLQPRDLPSNAVTSDHPDEVLLNAEEIYWFTDSHRNPPFSHKCRLIQFVRR